MTSLPIVLPDGFTPVVKVGDTVTATQVLAKKKNTAATPINIAHELNIAPEDVGKTIKKNPGETVEPGEVLAAKKGKFGMGEQKVVSGVSGTVTAYERRTGELFIKIDGDDVTDSEEEFVSPIDGKITLCDNGQIVIETDKDCLLAEQGTGGSTQGTVYVLSHDSKESVVPLHLLSPEIIDKIILGNKISRDGLLKAVGMDALGIIVSDLDEADLAYFSEKHITTPLLKVSSADFMKLKNRGNKQLFIDGDKKNIILLHT